MVCYDLTYVICKVLTLLPKGLDAIWFTVVRVAVGDFYCSFVRILFSLTLNEEI